MNTVEHRLKRCSLRTKRTEFSEKKTRRSLRNCILSPTVRCQQYLLHDDLLQLLHKSENLNREQRRALLTSSCAF